MNIGQAAAASGVSAKTIRYYEVTGLIPAASRTEAGYRVYDEHDVHTLRFIQRARRLGFAVPNIGQLLALWQDRNRASAEVKDMARAHMAMLDQKLVNLQSMKRTLEHLVAHCHSDDRPECPILDDLAGQGPGAPTSDATLRRQLTAGLPHVAHRGEQVDLQGSKGAPRQMPTTE